MKIILVFYAILYFHMAIHEGGHTFIARILGLKINEIKIGAEELSIKWRTLSISPVLSAGYVDVDNKEIGLKNPYKLLLFFEMGPLSNLLTGFIFQLALNNIYGRAAFWIGILFFVGNNIPFLKETDGYMIWKSIRHV